MFPFNIRHSDAHQAIIPEFATDQVRIDSICFLKLTFTSSCNIRRIEYNALPTERFECTMSTVATTTRFISTLDFVIREFLLDIKKALLPMSLKAKEACEVDSITVLAGKGYHNGEQIASCIPEHITTYVAVPDAPRNSEIPTPEYYGERFRYNKKQDTYTCPEGHVMKNNGNSYNRKYEQTYTRLKQYKTPKCRTCPAKSLCTSSPTGRVIDRSEHAEALQANTRRVKKHPEIYAARQQIVEHIFGTIKRQWGYDHILLKGLHKNDGEFGLIYLIYNFRR